MLAVYLDTKGFIQFKGWIILLTCSNYVPKVQFKGKFHIKGKASEGIEKVQILEKSSVSLQTNGSIVGQARTEQKIYY